mgnify:CR=1 FL=1
MEIVVLFLILLSMVFLTAMVIFIVFDVEPLLKLLFWLSVLTVTLGMVLLIVSFVVNVMTGKWVL